MHAAHLGPGDLMDFVEPPPDGPIVGYSHKAVAEIMQQRGGFPTEQYADGMNLYAPYFVPNDTDPSGLGKDSHFPRPKPRPPKVGSAVGFEGHFILGGGISIVQCKDKTGCPRVMTFWKTCLGGAAGGGASPMVVNMSGERCDPSFYSGWFYELGASIGTIGAGVDVGYGSFDENGFGSIIPGSPNGTIEGGAGIGRGLVNFKSTWCYYSLVSDTGAS